MNFSLSDLEDTSNDEFYFDPNQPCFKVMTDKSKLYSQLVTYLLNRMLKLILKLIVHDIECDPRLVENFRKIAKSKDRLTEVFILTKSRISMIEKAFILHNKRMTRNR